jgi:long-subunit fatty acid transport protein
MGTQDMASKMWKSLRKTGQKRRLNYVLAFAAVMAVSSAQLAQGAFFDTAGKSARPMGMGEVFLASAGDASSYWYNPAGLAKFEKKQVGLSYGIPVAAVSGLNISQVNFVTPLGKGSGLGLGVSYGGIDVASDMVISGGYALSLTDKFAIGGNAKIMRWSFDGQPDVYNNGKMDDNISKISFSLDLSATYTIGEMFGLGTFTTGVYVKDAIMPNISESGNDGGKLPVEAGIGLMMQKDMVMVEGDIAHVNGNTVFRIGAESGVSGTSLKLRGGFIYSGDLKGDISKDDINLGLGYSFGSVIFNYAYIMPLEFTNTNGRHFVSFGVSF